MTTRPFDIVTIGDTCVDLIVELGNVSPQFGQVEQWVSDYFLEMGGSTCIFACQAAKLGLNVAILGRVGDDAYGELVLDRLQQSGVDTCYVARDPSVKTGLGIALCRAGGDRAVLTYGGSLNAVYPGDITDDFLLTARHLHYGSYFLQTNLVSEAPRILRRAKQLGLSVSLDTNWDPSGQWDGGLKACLEQVDLFLPNDQEALAITHASTVREAIDIFRKKIALVVVKLGGKGALVGEGQTVLEAPVEPASHVVDTIGAGDSFDAGFVAGLLRGLSLESCAAIANACGRASTQARGGIMGQLTLADLPELRATRHP